MNTLVKNPTRSLSPSAGFNPFDRFFRNDFLDVWNDENLMTVPSINITEEKNTYKVELAAPGLKKEDFNIEVNGSLVTISSENETETKEPQKNNGYTRREYNYSSFSRSFILPEHADTGKITAKYTDGVLNLSIPKKPGAQKTTAQKIKVQ